MRRVRRNTSSTVTPFASARTNASSRARSCGLSEASARAARSASVAAPSTSAMFPPGPGVGPLQFLGFDAEAHAALRLLPGQAAGRPHAQLVVSRRERLECDPLAPFAAFGRAGELVFRRDTDEPLALRSSLPALT